MGDDVAGQWQGIGHEEERAPSGTRDKGVPVRRDILRTRLTEPTARHLYD